MSFTKLVSFSGTDTSSLEQDLVVTITQIVSNHDIDNDVYELSVNIKDTTVMKAYLHVDTQQKGVLDVEFLDLDRFSDDALSRLLQHVITELTSYPKPAAGEAGTAADISIDRLSLPFHSKTGSDSELKPFNAKAAQLMYEHHLFESAKLTARPMSVNEEGEELDSDGGESSDDYIIEVLQSFLNDPELLLESLQALRCVTCFSALGFRVISRVTAETTPATDLVDEPAIKTICDAKNVHTDLDPQNRSPKVAEAVKSVLDQLYVFNVLCIDLRRPVAGFEEPVDRVSLNLIEKVSFICTPY